MILINSSSKKALKIFQPFMPISVPVGVGCLVAFAQQKGVKARLIDEQVEDDILGVISEHVKEMDSPYIFGFSVLTAAFKNAILLSKELKKKYPKAVIVFGGIHPTASPDEVLAYDHVDVVIRGEAENAMVELYQCIKEGRDYTHIANLSYKKNNHIFHNDILSLTENLDELPDFPYSLFNPEKYDLGFVVSSRGCPYKCIFCSNRIITGRKYRYKSAPRIINDLDLLYHKYNQRKISFLDDNFLVSKERLYKLLDMIKQKEFDKKMTFGFQARGDNVNDKLLKDLYECGFRNIFFGIETASEDIMKTIKKDETVAQCISAVKSAKKAGFYTSATFIFGLPGDSHKNRMDCLKLSKELQLDLVRYNNATPYPGTELYQIAKQQDRLVIQNLYENFSSVAIFIENPFRKLHLPYVPEGTSENDIRDDTLYSYLNFYFNKHILTSIFKRPDDTGGWFNAGKTPVEIIKKLPAILFLFFLLSIKFVDLFIRKLLKSFIAVFPKHELTN